MLFQLIYVRIQDETTGCYTITNIELHANIIQNVYSNEAFLECDDPSNDGIADFDLAAIEIELEDGYDEFDTTFYETEEDRENDVNALNENTPYTVSNGGTTIYAKIVSDDCTELIDIVLQVAPAIILTPQVAEYCDDCANDGYTTLFMPTFDTIASQGVTPANVKYYLTEQDAIDNVNILSDYVYNSTNPQLFYIRVTNTQTECYGISTLEVSIVDAPEIMYPDPIVVCDDDQDGISTVNLESQIPSILTSTVGFEITFYTDYGNATSATNPIENPDDYTTSTQYIYARTVHLCENRK